MLYSSLIYRRQNQRGGFNLFVVSHLDQVDPLVRCQGVPSQNVTHKFHRVAPIRKAAGSKKP
jgi:hypothetical protein